MSSIVIAGDTSGSVTLQAPAVAGSTVLNLPATSGTIQASGAGYTTNGVAYATSATGLATSSALTFDGSNLATTNYISAVGLRSLGGGGVRFNNAGNTNFSFITAPAGTGDMQFETGAGEQMRLTGTGLGIGTTSPSTWGTKLVVYNSQLTITGGGYDGAYADSIFFGGNSEGTNYRNKISNSLSASVANQLMKFSVASGTSTWVDALILRGDGLINTGLATNSPYNATTGNAANANLGSDGILRRSTSSLKYKTDVQNTTHGLAEVLALRPVTYKGKSEADGDTVFGGLIAEEVHEAGLTEFVQYAQDGSPDALAYGNMVSLAFKAIQEQQALITTLTERITALEGV
jgi:hypothetical protein